GGLRPPAGSGRHDARPAAHVVEHARRRRRAARGRDSAHVPRGPAVSSYYGRPIIKEPTWTWEIPTYFFTGGLAGASSVLSTAARLAGNEKLARTSLYLGAVADIVSPALLISDLGRPERFHHMLRVVKVTSPMNVGSWVLIASGGASNVAAALELLGRLKPLKLLAETAATLTGAPLAT